MSNLQEINDTSLRIRELIINQLALAYQMEQSTTPALRDMGEDFTLKLKRLRLISDQWVQFCEKFNTSLIKNVLGMIEVYNRISFATQDENTHNTTIEDHNLRVFLIKKGKNIKWLKSTKSKSMSINEKTRLQSIFFQGINLCLNSIIDRYYQTNYDKEFVTKALSETLKHIASITPHAGLGLTIGNIINIWLPTNLSKIETIKTATENIDTLGSKIAYISAVNTIISELHKRLEMIKTDSDRQLINLMKELKIDTGLAP